MEFVEGRTVADVLAADHVVDPCRAAVIALEICEQLAKFHSWESAVVHGDIKPSNIHLEPQRHGAAARFRNRQDAARGLQRHRAPVRQPELLFAGTADARRSGSAIGSVGAGRDALRNAGRRAALPGRRHAQAGGADPIEAAAARAAGLVPGRLARHRHEVAGAGRRQAVPRRRSSSRQDLQLFLEQKPTLAEIGAAVPLESDRHPGGGARGTAPRHAYGAAQAGRAACRSWARRRTSLPECCSGSQARSAGRCGRRAPARRPAAR